MVKDRYPPEQPRAEPEIIPPDKTQSVRRSAPFAEMGGVHRVYVTRIGPFGVALLLLALAVFAAVALILFFGALFIWIPILALIAIIGALTGLLRSRRW